MSGVPQIDQSWGFILDWGYLCAKSCAQEQTKPNAGIIYTTRPCPDVSRILIERLREQWSLLDCLLACLLACMLQPVKLEPNRAITSNEIHCLDGSRDAQTNRWKEISCCILIVALWVVSGRVISNTLGSYVCDQAHKRWTHSLT